METGHKAAAPTSPDQLEFLGFADYGTMHITYNQLGEDPNVVLSSVGVGLRYVTNPYFSVRFDYSWRLRPTAANATIQMIREAMWRCC
jgi:hemolysin activation/secretion protein